MSHNTVLSAVVGGDTVRTNDTGAGYKNSVAQVAFGTLGSAETLVDSTHPLPATTGGSATSACPAGVGTAAHVVKGTPGRLSRVLVTALGTAAVSIYDDTAAATGTVLCFIPANTAAGTVFDLDMPAAAGIVVGKVNNSPAMTISFC